jgi:SIR2-like domain
MPTGEVTPEKGKRKLLVILGAGSSKPLGMPLVPDLDQLMKDWAKAWTTGQWESKWNPFHSFYDHFGTLWNAMEEYYGAAASGAPVLPNFENVLGYMMTLAHSMEPPPWGDPLVQRIGLAPLGLIFVDGPTVELDSQYSFMFRRLASYMRSLSAKMDWDSDFAKTYRKFFATLRNEFELGVYNLNYDNAALRALQGMFTGFSDSEAFQPRSVRDRTAWDFTYHLHGSVHHSFKDQGGNEIRWKKNLIGDQFYDGDGPEAQSLTDRRSGDLMLPRTTLVAGGFKLDQLLVEPFHSFHASLVRHVYAADAILIGGYGFGDAHINFALHNRLSHSQDRPPVMVLDRACEKPGPQSVEDRANWNDAWAVQLKRTLGAGVFKPSSHASLPRDVFEEASDCRVAVWQGGFVEAESQLSHIIRWLGVNN